VKSANHYINQEPVYGDNYAAGYTGFTARCDPGHISKGIAWFSRWDKESPITVTHALTVTGPGTCIEACMGEGIIESPLSKYFDDPDVLIFFRKPVNLDLRKAAIICEAASQHVGAGYDKALILAHAASGTFFGRLAALITRHKSDAFIAWLLDNPDKWICSEYAAWALMQVPEYKGHGVLRYPAATITPQELFECSVTYQPWKTAGVLL
jgi:hypothetical protein